MQIQSVKDYWGRNPCAGGNKHFPFHKYEKQSVLEIGCGLGVDAKRFVDAGADYTGIDLTPEATVYTMGHLWPKGKVKVMDAEHLQFPSDNFDLVYSFGVIHHALNPDLILNEVYRVLKPNGELFIMLYNKPSIRYNIDIMFIRKILWHLDYHRYKYIKMDNPNPTKDEWISWNTDTLGCPLARVYTKQEALVMVSKFHNVKTWTENWGWFRMIKGVK